MDLEYRRAILFTSAITSIILSAIVIARRWPPQSPGLDTVSLSPTRVVQSYYTYVSQGNIHDAVEFVTHKVSAQESLPGGDFTNVATLSGLSLKGPYHMPHNRHYKFVVQIVASFQVQWDSVIDQQNGEDTEFVYLGRNSRHQPWVITSIGSGP